MTRKKPLMSVLDLKSLKVEGSEYLIEKTYIRIYYFFFLIEMCDLSKVNAAGLPLILNIV